ncbi:hypothetical protein Tco_0802033 [Tanacetum coccineum]|uniref:Xylulose kinase-1 n=1 Tax=Tanacetum coccineum TaxID=301880 RepID=A0ABQ5A1P5_9ASTR
MTTMQFANTHNLVAFFAKPAESEGFEQVVDFLNAGSIRYALTIYPTIYTSCIEQFWSSVKVKTVNREQQLQGPVDRKKIIITEATNVHDADMFGVHDLDGDEVFVGTEEPVVNAATTTSTIPVSVAKYLSDVDMTLAQALAELKSTKPKAVTTAATITTIAVTRPKAKGLVIQEA